MIEGLSFAAALSAGLAASLHCLPMCGAVAGAFGLAQGPGCQGCVRQSLGYALIAQIGRIGSYGIAGVIAGGIGMSLVAPAAGWLPEWLPRALLGASLLLAAVIIGFGRRLPDLLARPAQRVWRQLAPLSKRLLPINSAPRALAFGALWGWLPCGLVYAMLLAAWFSASPAIGGGLLIAFGLGTLPAMLLATAGSAPLARLSRGQAGRRGLALLAAGLAVAAFAVPFLAHPSMEIAGAAVLDCQP